MKVSLLPIASIAPSQSKFQRHRRAARSAEAIAEIAESIRENGIIQPIIVRPIDETEPACYEIIAGEGRWTGAKKAGLEEIPAIIRTDLDESAALQLQITENLQRAELDHITEAIGYSELLHLGVIMKDIAARCGKSQATIQRKLALANLTETEQAHVTAGDLHYHVAYELGRMTENDRAQHLPVLLENRHTWNQKQALNYIQHARHRDRESTTWQKRRAELSAIYPGCIFLDYDECEKHFAHTSESPRFESPYRLAKTLLDRRYSAEYQLPSDTTWGKLADQLSAPKYIMRNGRGEPVLCVENILLDKLASIRDSKKAPRKHYDDPVPATITREYNLPAGIKWGALALQIGAVEDLTQPIFEKNVLDILRYGTAEKPIPTAAPTEPADSHHAPPRHLITQDQINALVDTIPEARLDLQFIAANFRPLIAAEFREIEIETPADILRIILKIRASIYIKNQSAEDLTNYHAALTEL